MSCQNEVTRDEATPETIQQAVQARGSETHPRQRKESVPDCTRARSADQRALGVESDGRGRGENRHDARRAPRAQAAAQGQRAARDGGRDFGKSDGLLRQPKQVRFAFIEAKKAEYSVSALCRVLEVERSGFYAWRSREESDHAVDDRRLAVEVRAAFEESKRRYGSPRVYRVLRREGVRVGRHRVARLMREQKLQARRRRKFVATTDSKHNMRTPS